MNIKLLHNKYFKLKENKFTYGSILPKFAIGNKTRNTVKAISYFEMCRETLVGHFRHKISNDLINTKVLNLLVWFTTPERIMVLKNNKRIHININDKKNYFEYVSAEYSRSIYRALCVLNMIEKELRWRKTTIKKITHRLGNKHSLYLLTASSKWMFSPPLLSLYTLILRAGAFKNISGARSIDKLATAYTRTTENQALNQSTDIIFLKKISPILKKLLINVNKIYKGRSQKMNFGKSVLNNASRDFDEGITKLVNGETGDKLILGRFLKYTHK